MTTQKYQIPSGRMIEQDANGEPDVSRETRDYLKGIEDATGRVADFVDPGTATPAQLATAMIAAGLMKES